MKYQKFTSSGCKDIRIIKVCGKDSSPLREENGIRESKEKYEEKEMKIQRSEKKIKNKGRISRMQEAKKLSKIKIERK